VHQFWLPGRDPTMKDWLMDVFAAIVTIAVLMLWRARRASKC
jgi:VanZ family protein